MRGLEKHMKMTNLLNNLTFGEKQEVGVMSVIPLIGEDVTEELGTLENIEFNGTTNYGTMVFSNKSNKPTIVPTGYSYITKQAAQDHGTTNALLLASYANKKTFDITCCIQQTQGGFITQEKTNEFYLLPLSIKKKHFEDYFLTDLGNSFDFRRLWGIITEFQMELVQKQEAHLIYFFTKFMDKLNKFNAEFEIVPKQRGAVIMLNDKVIGVEIAPSHDYWKSIWHKLIRDCYGAEVIRLTHLNLVKEFKNSQDGGLNLEGCKSLEDIENVIEQYNNTQKENIKETLNNLFDKEFTIVKHNKVNKYNIDNRISYAMVASEDKSSFGEIFESKDNEILYCSMMFA